MASPAPAWKHYVLAAVALALTVAVRGVLELAFAEKTPTYLVFLAPVICVSLLAGAIPGLLVTVGGLFTLQLLFIDPTGSFASASDNWVIAGVFLVEGAVIALVGGRLRGTVADLVAREQELGASEARLIIAQQAARIATYEWDPTTGRSVWSENAEAVMARSPGTFDGTFEDSFRTVVPEDRPLLDAAAEQLLREGRNELEFRVTDLQGGLRWIRGTGTLTKPDSQGRVRVVGVMMDVTDRRRASEHSQFLSDVTADFASSLDYRTNVADVAKIAVRSFCDIAVVVLATDGVLPGVVVSRAHRNPLRLEYIEALEAALSASPGTPGFIAQSIQAGTPFFLPKIVNEQIEGVTISDSHRQALDALDLASAICIPLVARERTLGALIFAQESGRTFDQTDFEVAKELGRRAALAIENSLLLEQSFEREGEVSRANEALQMVADAGTALGSTLDLSQVLNGLTELVVPRFADVCSISLVEDGRLEPIALAAITDDVRTAIAAMPDGGVISPDLMESAVQVLRSDRPIFLREIPAELLRVLSAKPQNAELMKSVSPRSLILMPLSARGQTLGVMTFIRVAGSSLFDREDLSLAGQIARRTAVATDNSR
jgi:GAF domain-containing protein/PAS domain-containing protein